MEEGLAVNGVFNFVFFHSVISSWSVVIFCLSLFCSKAYPALPMILVSAKLLLLNFILQPLGMTFSWREQRLNMHDLFV